jgi:hypothetical protein
MMLDFNSKGLMLHSVQAETLKTEKAVTGDLASTLTMTVVGIISSRLFTCKLTIDMLLAAAGGATFIAGEVLETVKLRKVMKDLEMQIDRDKKDGSITQEQITSLEKLKKSYEEAKSTAGTKKTIQLASAAAFVAAAVAAYLLVAQETTAQAACTAGLASAATSCPGLVTASTATLVQTLFGTRTIPSPSAAGLAKQITSEAGVKSSELAVTGQSQALVASYGATCATPGGGWACPLVETCGTAPAQYEPACLAITPVLKLTSGYCPGSLGIVQNSSTPKSYYAKSMSSPQLFIMSLLLNSLKPDRANADLLSPMGITSGAAISFLMFTSKTLGPTIDSLLLAPMNRAILWGILAGLAFAASTSTDNVISQIEKNISKIDAILNDLNSTLPSGTSTTQVAKQDAAAQTMLKPNSNAQFNANDYESIDLNKNGANLALPCYTGPSGQPCKSFADTAKDIPSYTSLNGESQMQIQGILSTANGFNGTSKIAGATLKGANTLAGQANALKSALDKAKKNASDTLKKAGSNFNIDGQTKKWSDQIEKGVNDSLKQGNATPSSMMASMYGGPSSGASDVAKISTADAVVKKPKAGSFSGNVVDIGAGANSDKSDLGLGLAAAPKGLSAEELTKKNADENAAAGTMDQYALKNDITTDKSASIFELISNRYQRSGYPRLLKLKEPQTPTPVTK